MVMGRRGEKISPFFFYLPGGGTAETYAAPLRQSESKLVFRINSLDAFTLMVEKENREPGAMKRMLAWITPFSPPPCWHQIGRIELKPSKLGVDVHLHLKEGICHDENY